MDPAASCAPDRPTLSPDIATIAHRVAEQVGDLLSERFAAPPLLDLAGAAARLAVSERTVESLVSMGELPVVRIGTGRGVRRFEPAALDAFIRRQARTL